MSRNHAMQHDLSGLGLGFQMSSCSGRMCEDAAHKGLMRSINSPLTRLMSLDKLWNKTVCWRCWTCILMLLICIVDESLMNMNWHDSKWSQYRWRCWSWIECECFHDGSNGLAVVIFFELAPWKPLEQDGVLCIYVFGLLLRYSIWCDFSDDCSRTVRCWLWPDMTVAGQPLLPCHVMAIYGTLAGFPKVSPAHYHYVNCFIGSFYFNPHILDPTSSAVSYTCT